MLTGGASEFGLVMDYGVLVGVTAVLVAIAARMYPRMAV
jgi:hypothetical protein